MKHAGKTYGDLWGQLTNLEVVPSDCFNSRGVWVLQIRFTKARLNPAPTFMLCSLPGLNPWRKYIFSL